MTWDGGAILPKDEASACRVLNEHIDRVSLDLGFRKTRWRIGEAYLASWRVINTAGWMGDPVEVAPVSQDEMRQAPLDVPRLLSEVNRVTGLFNGIDMRPFVSRNDTTLTGLRERAVLQVLLNAAVKVQQLDGPSGVKKVLTHQFAFLGTGALHAFVDDFPRIGLHAELEVVHPQEVFPWPQVGSNLGQLRGIGRVRWIPLERLKANRAFKKAIAGREGDLETDVRQAGEARPEGGGVGYGGGTFSAGGPTFIPTKRLYGDEGEMRGGEVRLARVVELWEYAEGGFVERAFAGCGKVRLFDETYARVPVCCPLSVGRFMENGQFHGAGLYDMLYSLCRRHEKLIGGLAQNAEDAGRYPIVFAPAGTFDQQTIQNPGNHDLRIIPVDQEGVGPYGQKAPLRVTAISPINSGDTPGKTATFLDNQIRSLSPVGDIIRDKGRADSLPALQFLEEADQKSVANPVSSLVGIFSNAYKYIGFKATALASAGGKPVPIGALTLDLVGAVVDFENAVVSFTGGVNPVPDATRQVFTTRQTAFKSQATRKVEAMSIHQMRGDWTKLEVFALDEGLDLATYMTGAQNARDALIENVIRLFNDGQTTGQIVTTPHTERPDIQLMMLKDFMSGPVLKRASAGVVRAFQTYFKQLTEYSGAVLPQATPDPYEAAVIQAAQVATMTGKAMSGGGGSGSRLPLGGKPASFVRRRPGTAGLLGAS